MKIKTVQLVYTALLIALGVVLPIGFHLVGAGGPIFLPMHIPVFLAGILLGPWLGMVVGMIAPLLSSLMTGMPPFLPMLPIMFIELGLYGFTIGLLVRNLRVKLYPALMLSMLFGRIGAGIVVWALVHIFDLTRLPANPLIFIWGSIVKGLPGIVIQLVLIPVVLHYLRRGNKDVEGIFQY